MNVEIKISKVDDGERPAKSGTITIGAKSGEITIYSDSSNTITPAWLESVAIRAAGSKAIFRNIIRDAYSSAGQE